MSGGVGGERRETAAPYPDFGEVGERELRDALGRAEVLVTSSR